MRVSLTPDSAAISPTATAETLSPWARAFAIFARPASAWVGLETRAQWWFPLLIVTTVAVAGTAALQKRAIIPMQAEAMEQQLQSGSMSPAQVQKMEDFLASPGGYALTVVPQIIFVPAFALLIALVIWFGVGFVIGSPMKYRHALEVACWANLVQLPGFLIAYVEAWFLQSFKGVHVGLGAILPADAEGKLFKGLAVLLDALGPFYIWYVIVGILGASALSGAPRRPVAWVLSSLYLIIVVVSAVLSALFTPAG